MNEPREIETATVVTLLSVIAMSMMMSVSDQIPAKSALATKIKKVEDAIKGLAGLHSGPLPEEVIEAGIAGWNSAIKTIERELSK